MAEIGVTYSPDQVDAMIAAAARSAGLPIPSYVTGVSDVFENPVASAAEEITRELLNDPAVLVQTKHFAAAVSPIQFAKLSANNAVEQQGFILGGTIFAFRVAIGGVTLGTIFTWLTRIFGSYQVARAIKEWLSGPNRVAVYVKVGRASWKLVTIMSAEAAVEFSMNARRKVRERYRFRKAGK